MAKFIKLTWYIAAIIAAVLFTSAALGRTSASVPCSAPNVMPSSVCDMDSFYATDVGEVPEGWTPFVLSGQPEYSQHVDTYWGPPSLCIRVFDDAFKAGIYTQVAVQPGAGYRASAAWGAPNQPDFFGRQLGLDPTGGTDPNSPNVVWGPMHWGPARMLNYPPPDVNIDVLARAIGDTMTVFFYVDHVENPGDNLIFIDAISLFRDESAPEVTPKVTPEVTPNVTPNVTPESPSFLPMLACREAPILQPTATPAPTTNWTEPLRIAGSCETGVTAAFGSQPAVIESEDSLLIAYSLEHGDDGASGEDEAFVQQNIASSGWQTPTAVSDVAPGESAGAPSLLLDVDLRGHALWTVRTQGTEELAFEYARRNDVSTWAAPEPVPTLSGYRTMGHSGTHYLAQVEDESIGVLWLGQAGTLNEVHGAIRNPTGWTEAETISPETDVFGALFPGVVRTSDSALQVMWHEFAGETRYAVRDAAAAVWTAPMTATQKSALYHMMAPGDDGDVHLLRQHESRLEYVYKARVDDWKTAFLASETVADEYIGRYYGLSSLAVDSKGVPHVAWISGTKLMVASKDAAVGWISPMTLFERPGADITSLYLFADNSGGLHLLWREDGEIWYSTTSELYP